MTDSHAYAAVAKAVNGRWRRRFLVLAHLIVAIVFLMQMAYATTETHTYMDFSTGLEQTYTYTLYTYQYQVPGGIVYMLVVAMHVLCAFLAEFRDRVIRREIERERKWQLIERLDSYDPYQRERALRLAEVDDGQIVDLETALREPEYKLKRG
jgi:hypothetical protein